MLQRLWQALCFSAETCRKLGDSLPSLFTLWTRSCAIYSHSSTCLSPFALVSPSMFFFFFFFRFHYSPPCTSALVRVTRHTSTRTAHTWHSISLYTAHYRFCYPDSREPAVVVTQRHSGPHTHTHTPHPTPHTRPPDKLKPLPPKIVVSYPGTTTSPVNTSTMMPLGKNTVSL